MLIAVAGRQKGPDRTRLPAALCARIQPDEYLNRDFKTALRTGPVSHDKASLLKKATAFMSRLATLPEHVMAYFRHPSAAYAAQGI